MRAEGLLDGRQCGAVHLGAIGIGLQVADQLRRWRAVGIAVRPTQFTPWRQACDRLGRMVVDVGLHDAAVGVGDVVAVVDRGPQRPVRGERKPRSVAHAGRERFGRTTAGRHPHDGGPRRVGRAVLGRDVARGPDREVHGAVVADDDALECVGVGAAQVGALGVGKTVDNGAAVHRGAVGVVVGVDLIALGHVQRRPREEQSVRLVQPVEQGALCGKHFQHLAGAGDRDEQGSVGCPRGHAGLGHPRDDLKGPPVRDESLTRLVERCVVETFRHLDRHGCQLSRTGGVFGGGLRRRSRRLRCGLRSLRFGAASGEHNGRGDDDSANPRPGSHASPKPGSRPARRWPSRVVRRSRSGARRHLRPGHRHPPA